MVGPVMRTARRRGRQLHRALEPPVDGLLAQLRRVLSSVAGRLTMAVARVGRNARNCPRCIVTLQQFGWLRIRVNCGMRCINLAALTLHATAAPGHVRAPPVLCAQREAVVIRLPTCRGQLLLVCCFLCSNAGGTQLLHA